MCGRFIQAAKPEALAERFDAALPSGAPFVPRYNLAPLQGALVVAAAGQQRRKMECCVWGLVPAWAKRPTFSAPMINARVETVWEKPSFRNPLRYRRCLVPANGFYEWRSDGNRKGQKTPYLFTVKDQPQFAFGGLWEVWADKQGGELYSFTIITCPANAFMRAYHHRMPLILSPAQEAAWMDHTLYRPAELAPLLKGSPSLALSAHAVSRRVNHVTNDDADCVRPVPEQGALL